MESLIAYASDAHDLNVSQMVINLVDPLVDAGDVAQAVQASAASLEAVEIASFDDNRIYDFRAQRPIVSFKDGALVDVALPHMAVTLATDMHGQPFLYVCGQEPDFQWLALSKDLIDMVRRFNVQQVYSFAGMAAGVPHTRPADMLIRSPTRQDVQHVLGSAEHFAQLQDVFEYQAGQEGISVTNIRVRVPFYMAKGAQPFVSGALAVIKMTAQLGGPTLPLGDLEQLEDQQAKALDGIVEEGSDFSELLEHLEEEYDKLPSNAGLARSNEAMPAMPTAEEISRAVDQFVATMANDPLMDAREPIREHADVHESDKHKDGSRQDFTHAAGAAPQSLFTGRERRGKHHFEKSPAEDSRVETSRIEDPSSGQK